MKYLKASARLVVALAGGYLLFRLIRSVGWRLITDSLLQHGRLIVLITAAYVLYHALRTWTLEICLKHPTPFARLFGIRLAGEALAHIAVGSIVGDTLKVVLARRHMPAEKGAAGVFAEKLIYHTSGAAFVAGGLFIALFRFGIHPLYVCLLAASLVAVIVLVLLMSSGVRPVGRFLNMLPPVKSRPHLRETILRTEKSLFLFRKRRPAAFLLVLFLNLASYFYGIAETMVILRGLGMDPSWLDVWYYQAVVKIANVGALVVPANLGIFETTSAIVAGQLHFGRQSGIIVALLIRIRAIAWSALGYLWFLWFLSPQAAAARRKSE